jgi:hypothetical protein
MTDTESEYRQAERQLRDMLFGDGETSVGIVKGEERRVVASRILRRMRLAFDQASERGGSVAGAPLDDELRRGLKDARDRAERDLGARRLT